MFIGEIQLEIDHVRFEDEYQNAVGCVLKEG